MMTAMYSVIDDVISSHDLIMSPIRAMTFVILSDESILQKESFNDYSVLLDSTNH